MLYADTPIDSSLLSLYIHQNYTQYCNEIDECANVVDWLSYVDSSGGDTVCPQYSSPPHRTECPSVAAGEPAPLPPAHARHDACTAVARPAPRPEVVQTRVLRRPQAREGRGHGRRGRARLGAPGASPPCPRCLCVC